MNVMERAARKASRGLLRDFGEVEHLQVSAKGPADFVSTADLNAEKVLREELTRARPDFGLVMEESGEVTAGDGARRWIVDPLDGAKNFLHGIPMFCISIAVESLVSASGAPEREIIAGLIYDPINDASYWAEKGEGAYRNNHRLRVSGRRDLATSVLASGSPVFQRTDHATFLGQIDAAMNQIAGLRRFGSAALHLAFVAAGRFEGYWEEGLKAWDIAAGILLVREAGGFVSEIDGGADMMTSGSILAANYHLHRDIQAMIAGAEPLARCNELGAP
jgi:myo-inositol-1(or 4)-monophosphatase